MRYCMLALLALAACQNGPAHPIGEVTQVADFTAPAEATSISASISLKGTDPAIARLYHVPAVHAARAQTDIAAAGGALGRWAMGSRARHGFIASETWETAHLRALLPIEKGDLIILAIEPVSAAHGGRFVWRTVRISTGEAE